MSVAKRSPSLRVRAMSFGVDFNGRLKKVRAPVSASLHAVFEAIANAFDATEHLGEAGHIVVRIHSEEKKSHLPIDGQQPEYVLTGFEIEDNGVGFTDVNLTHFKRSDTEHKPKGKGVGRLLWLHVFDSVRIESVYQEGGKKLKREFTFSRQHQGVKDGEDHPRLAEMGERCGTVVFLDDPKPERLHVLTKTAASLAEKILEHFLLHFTVLGGQRIEVVDLSTGDEVVVNKLFADVIGQRHKEEPFSIRNYAFTIHHLFIRPTVSQSNIVNLCANRRLVRSDYANDYMPEIGRATPLTTPAQGSYRYHGYVTGLYLDENVDDERTSIKFAPNVEPPDDESEPDGSPANLITASGLKQEDIEGVSEREFFKCVAGRIQVWLAEHLADVRQRKEKQLEQFATADHPQFRPFLESAKKRLDRLPARPTKRKIELAFYEAKIDGREEVERLTKELLTSKETTKMVDENFNRLVDRFAQENNRACISALAEYVCARKAVLNVFEAALGRNDDGNKHYEKVIHDLFVPRYAVSDVHSIGPTDVEMTRLDNLWILDERLAFTSLIASELVTSAHPATPANAEERPDVLVYDRQFVVAEDVESPLPFVAVIEFKRPGKAISSIADSPVQQIINTVKKIRKGNYEDGGGRNRDDFRDLPVYGYAVADLSPTFRDMCVWNHNMDEMPGGNGYISYGKDQNYIIEVVSYSKLVNDSKRRNLAFFKKLGM